MNLVGYIAAAGVVVVAPGADTLVVVKNALTGGAVRALRSAAGVCSGLAVWALLSAVGLAALLAASTALFTVVKVVGAAYLIFLGVKTILSARQPTEINDSKTPNSWRQGMFTNLGNPKVGIFYTSFLPQFITDTEHAFTVSLLLAAIHIALSFVCLLAYAFLVLRLGNIFQRERWRRTLDVVMGGTLCGLGVALVASSAVGSN
ncbi:threonine transporter RhtB [Longimycelium tulufanense]|uniref:Threonine transporter RhtB n=1 Tax=Longimycelium tulufanense TaxID=907463 RepID=A0A8J3C9N0_9PSEU|nr:LysE family translocator [Longimycelium tulufanense]GGM32860.1 threonine transporter RhtB [Longimycelium tulufanense]